MLKERTELEKYLETKCERVVFDKKKTEEILTKLNEKYSLPTGTAMNLIAGRVGFPMVSKIILFYLLDGIDSSKIETYFTPLEVEEFGKSKYVIPHELSFPLRIKIMQVADDQWIGATTAGFYLGLLRSSLIRYNANTQRVLKKIVKNQEEEFKIELNKGAVASIRDLMQSHGFVSNTLTLNIPEDSDAKFYYDKTENELVINSIETFDILDGYHRLIAICDAYNVDEEFDYPMELRITNFSEQKAKQFIFQEDQKTLMKKIDSESMNSNSDANFVVERLNTDLDSNLKGLIGRNEGVINYSEMAAIINRLYFKKSPVKKKIIVLKDLKSKFNLITDDHDDLLDSRMQTKLLYALLVAFDMVEMDELQEKVNRIINTIDSAKVNLNNLSSNTVYLYFKAFVKEA